MKNEKRSRQRRSFLSGFLNRITEDDTEALEQQQTMDNGITNDGFQNDEQQQTTIDIEKETPQLQGKMKNILQATGITDERRRGRRVSFRLRLRYSTFRL